MLSFRERKVIRDAFNLFDVDGSGTVTKEEVRRLKNLVPRPTPLYHTLTNTLTHSLSLQLGNVMETLFGQKMNPADLKAMVKQVDVDGDGEISFNEFLDKVTRVMLDTAAIEEQEAVSGKKGEAKKGTKINPHRKDDKDHHWRKLGTLIKNFQDDNKAQGALGGAQRKHLFENHKKLEAEKKKVELSRQHDQMVKHFNLRRMSVDVDEDELARKLRLDLAKKGLVKKKTFKEKRDAFKHRMLKEPMEPDTRFRRSWDVMMMFLVIFQAMYIPYSVAWQINWGSEWYFDTIVDVLFITDLCMSFNLAYRPHPQADLVKDRKKIAINYLKCWFWIDLVASVPFDKIALALSDGDDDASASSALGLLKGLRLPRLLRLLKIMRLLKVFRMAHIRPELMWWFQYRCGRGATSEASRKGGRVLMALEQRYT